MDLKDLIEKLKENVKALRQEDEEIVLITEIVEKLYELLTDRIDTGDFVQCTKINKR